MKVECTQYGAIKVSIIGILIFSNKISRSIINSDCSVKLHLYGYCFLYNLHVTLTVVPLPNKVAED